MPIFSLLRSVWRQESAITIVEHFSIASGIQKRKRKQKQKCARTTTMEYFLLEFVLKPKTIQQIYFKSKDTDIHYCVPYIYTCTHKIHGHWIVLFSRLSRCNDSATCWTETIRYSPKMTIPIDTFFHSSWNVWETVKVIHISK